jgi:hypothetical protein
VSWDLWDHRNGVNIRNQETEHRQKNAANIQCEFNQGMDGLDSYDRRLFQKGLAHILMSATPQQDAWIRRITLHAVGQVEVLHTKYKRHIWNFTTSSSVCGAGNLHLLRYYLNCQLPLDDHKHDRSPAFPQS